MKKLSKNIIIYFLLAILLITSALPSYRSFAGPLDDMEARKSLPVDSDKTKNWPEGPKIGAGSAILMDAQSGVILYEKNINEKMFPASTTKLMTCLLAMEKKGTNLNDMVSFSHNAVYTVPWDGSNMGIDENEAMTLEDCLYGILVLSANEVSNAVGEYVSGTPEAFVDLMNQRAKELGCKNTHFNNAHGYYDPYHYTCAYDLALIGREFFKNELLCKISRTRKYHWYPTPTQPDDIELASKNYFVNQTYECEGFIGSKTGYTDESRQVLVSAAERNGMKLIAVVMQDETPYQYEDTLALFNYGFNYFVKTNVSDCETKYTITDSNFFHSDNDVFGDSSPIMNLDKNATVIIPKTVSFSELKSTISYDNADENSIAFVSYSFNGRFVGKANISIHQNNEAFAFNETPFSDSKDGITRIKNENNDEAKPKFIYVNAVIRWIFILLGIFVLALFIKRLISNYHFAKRRQEIMHKHNRRR